MDKNLPKLKRPTLKFENFTVRKDGIYMSYKINFIAPMIFT